MSNKNDEKAFSLLEKAVYKAQDALAETKQFQAFLMLLTDTSEIEVYENEIKESTQSYEALEKILKERIKKGDIDIMILAVDTQIPDKVAKGVDIGIRLHLEEKSQRNNKIGGRFLYVPYELCQAPNTALYVKLHAPLPIGFPAEYIV
ncbi:hypothetical protein MNB_SV-13-2010 [hydrothermal vent metagenome]|uniref:Uncharacterized protein n=1 Tax=hydrothermal vent metagenome TaxID=652676 RepID=A0A1W1D0G0_9ZZZZ